MAESTTNHPRDAPEATHSPRAKAVAAFHLLALRRQFDAIREVFGDGPPHRSREFIWVALEVILAELQGERIALRDLVLRAEGVLSAPTLPRIVAELEVMGFLLAESASNSRLKLLRPSARTMRILVARADAAFGEFVGVVSEAERRLTEERAQSPA
ncbi:MAG: hypothetical protein IRY87_17750 [Acetobacteraceae bacterium]|nr:hypothetical protein [Acetobacteraceae bacterium]